MHYQVSFGMEWVILPTVQASLKRTFGHFSMDMTVFPYILNQKTGMRRMKQMIIDNTDNDYVLSLQIGDSKFNLTP